MFCTFRLIADDSDPELNRRNGQRVEVLRPLSDAEADLFEVGPMYKVRFADGYITDAFIEELEKIL